MAAIRDTSYLVGGKRPDLSAAQRPLEDEMINRVKADPQSYIDSYISSNTDSYGITTFNIDNARELFPEYKNYKGYRLTHTETTTTASSYIAYEAYRQELARLEAEGKAGTKVIFTGGMPGAGKSESLRRASKGFRKVNSVSLVYDSNLASFDNADDIIGKALEHKQRALIMFVYRDPIEAYKASLKRAEETGRTVRPDEMIETYLNQPDTMARIISKYGDDPRVQVLFIDNNTKIGGGQSDLSQIDPVDFFKKFTYSKEDLTKAFKEVERE